MFAQSWELAGGDGQKKQLFGRVNRGPTTGALLASACVVAFASSRGRSGGPSRASYTSRFYLVGQVPPFSIAFAGTDALGNFRDAHLKALGASTVVKRSAPTSMP